MIKKVKIDNGILDDSILDLIDITNYIIEKDNKSIKEYIDKHKQKKKSIFQRIFKFK